MAADAVPIAIGRILAVGVGRDTAVAECGWGEWRRVGLTPEVEGDVNGFILAVNGSAPLPLKCKMVLPQFFKYRQDKSCYI